MPTRIKEHDTDGFQLNGNHLEDVNLVGINDGEVIAWDANAGEFVAVDLDLDGKVGQAEFDNHSARHESGGADEINVGGLSGVLADRQDADKLQGHDIQDTAPSDGQILIWNESESRYEPQDPPTQIDELNDIPDVSADNPAQGDVLIFEGDAGGTNQWDSVENVLRVHTDVSPLAPSDGQVLTWDSNDSLWKPEDPSVGVLDLDELGDVEIDGEETNDVISYDGTNWINLSFPGDAWIVLRMSSNQTIPADNTFYVVEFDTVHAGSAANASDNGFVAPVDGVYMVVFRLHNLDEEQFEAAIGVLNASGVIGFDSQMRGAKIHTRSDGQVPGAGVYYLRQGDRINIQVRNQGNSSMDVWSGTGTRLGVFLVSPLPLAPRDNPA